ncbi:MAG: hypothetical protein V4439_00895 [Patescibacteria group bacterium]
MGKFDKGPIENINEAHDYANAEKAFKELPAFITLDKSDPKIAEAINFLAEEVAEQSRLAYINRHQFDLGSREAIKKSREIKVEASGRGIKTSANPGKYFKAIYERVANAIDQMITDNARWVSVQEKKVLDILPEEDPREIHDFFGHGLKMFFLQQFRLESLQSKEHSKEKVSISLQDPQYIKDQIFAYSFDFIQSLKESAREEVTPRQALRLAELTYQYNPGVLQEFMKKYPQIEKGVILVVLTAYRNPEEFLNSYITRVEELTKKYKGKVGKGVISQAALGYAPTKKNPNNSEKFIETYMLEVIRLRGLYPGVSNTVLHDAASNHPNSKENPRNSENSLDSYLLALKTLSANYPKVDTHVIQQFILKYRANAKDVIDRYINKLPELMKKYKELGVNNYAIRFICMSTPSTKYHPDRPEKNLDSYIEKLDDLRKRYGKNENKKDEGVDDIVLKYAIFANLSNSEGYIKNYIQFLGELKKNYDGVVDKRALNHASRRYCLKEDGLEKAKNFLNKYITEVERLLKKYLGFEKDTTLYAALKHPDDPDTYIEECQKGLHPKEEQEADLNNPDVIGDLSEIDIENIE